MIEPRITAQVPTVALEYNDPGGEEFGQSEPLTTRLQNLVHNYPSGPGIFKEFVQNADDAKASRVQIILDRRRHADQDLPDSKMAALQGPAILVVNDAQFSLQDLSDIQRIGRSGKSKSGSKTGRFGLGFNSAYNVTDFPCFVTRDIVAVFDPHTSVVPCATDQKPGRLWRLKECWSKFPDLVRPFGDIGLATGSEWFPHTAFRLPLRTPTQAEKSDICNTAYTESDFHEVLEQLKETAGEMLLFLKHVLNISVSEIREGNGGLVQLLEVSTVNRETVQAKREEINCFIRDSHTETLESLQAAIEELPRVSYLHVISVGHGSCAETQSWRVVSGLYRDDEGEVLKAAHAMHGHGETAIPLAGAATRIDQVKDPLKKGGRLYCFLPLPLNTGLPAHVNGFFDLSDSRQTIFWDETARGKGACRFNWNRQLITHVIPNAYADLIVAIKEDFGKKNPLRFYQQWPAQVENGAEWLPEMRFSTYRFLEKREVIRTAGQSEWRIAGEVFVLPPEWKDLQAPLKAERMPVPTPSLPAHITQGFRDAILPIKELEPSLIRDYLRVDEDINVEPCAKNRPALRKRKWVESLLRFCLSDDPGKELSGVPLAITANGKIRTIGVANEGSIFLAGALERQILESFPELFIDEAFGLATKLSENTAAGIYQMSVDDVVSLLKQIVGSDDEGSGVPWKPRRQKCPNELWLQNVYTYLQVQDLRTVTADLKNVPLVPDQNSLLHCMGFLTTPLVMTFKDDALRRALDKLCVPIVTGRGSLLNAIQEFTQKNQGNFIWPITPIDLIDTLAEVSDEWSEEVARHVSSVHDPLLNFLSKGTNLEGIRSKPESLDKLKKLSLFPLSDDSITDLDREVAYVSREFRFPAISLNLRSLKTGPRYSWNELLVALGARCLDLASYIQKELLPAYGNLPSDQQVTALEWIRDNMDTAQSDLEKQDPELAAEFILEMRQAALFRCTDGELHAASEIYMPEANIAREVLGESARFPDMKDVYTAASLHWLQFFRKLEIASSPRVANLYSYAETLAARGEDEGPESVTSALLGLFTHIQKHWDELSGGDAEKPTKEFSEFIECLRELRWLPAMRDEPRRNKYPGLVMPENRLFAPVELYSPRNGQLVASQAPISSFVEPVVNIRDALGFPVDPPPHIVMAHFDTLRKLWEVQGERVANWKSFAKALGTIYTYFGRMLPKGRQDDDEEMDEDEAPLEDADIFALKERYQATDCLWSPESRKFWPPRAVFATDVGYMLPWRTWIRAKNDASDRGYTALGRKDKPAVEDHIQFLDDLANEFGDDPMPIKACQAAIQTVNRLAEQLRESASEATDVFVPTRDNRLMHASVVYVDDAPWLEGRLESQAVAILADTVSLSIIKPASIRRLSDAVHEELESRPQNSIAEDFVQKCHTWKTLIRTREFAAAVNRLVQHEERALQDGALEWLTDVSVRPAESLRTVLYVDIDDREKRVGSGEASYYYDSDENAFYLNGSRSHLLNQNLAQALNQELDDSHLRNLLPLSTILECKPEQIEGVLDDLRIRSFAQPVPRDVYDDVPGKGVEEVDFSDDEESTVRMADGTITEWDDQENVGSSPNDPSSEPNQKPYVEEEGSRDRRVSDFGKVDLSNGAESIPTEDDLPEGEGAEPERESAGRPGGGSATDRVGVPGRDYGERGDNALRGHGPVEPRTKPRDTRSRPQPQCAPQHQLISYVDHGEGDEGRDEANRDTESPSQKRITGKYAERAVMKHEAERRGWAPEQMPPGHKGFDIRSVGSNDEVRYIEVKGINGPWGARGVSLSPSQFDFARENPDKDYWIYIVEYAQEPNKTEIYTIQSPAKKVSHYYFDHGWKELASPTRTRAQGPVAGMYLQVDGKTIGKIMAVTKHGVLTKLQVKCEGRSLEDITFKPSSMKVVEDRGGQED